MFGRIQSRKLYIPLVTILGLAVVFVAYSYVYLSRQESYLNERAFRLLSVVGDQLTKHFDNLKSVMAASLVFSPGEAAGGNEARAAGYLRKVAGRGGNISILKASAPCPKAWRREGEMKLYLVPNQAISLKASFAGTHEGQPSCSLDAQVDPAAEFRERFRDLTADHFDDILIATSSGEVLFESNPSGLHISSLETLVSAQASNAGAKPEPDAKDGKSRTSFFRDISQFSNVREVRFAGSLYKLYVQPVALQVFADEAGKQTVKTVVCGLSRIDRQQTELVSVPYATLIWGVLGVFALFGLSWPVLKVAYMSPTERLQRSHVYSLIASALFVTAVLTALVMNSAYMSRLDQDARRQLTALAASVDKNVKVELARALTFMNRLECERCSARPLLASATADQWTRARILEEDRLRSFIGIYPYFDNLFWADAKGDQLFKLSVRSEATPHTPVTNETYFRAVRDNKGLKSLAKPKEPWGGTQRAPEYDDTVFETPFRLETRYSRNTGEYFVILAKPALRKQLPPYLAGAVAQVLVTKFVSLQQPVLPDGFGYAIVDRDGLVQFHSNEGSNQIENFFKESRENPVIQAMVSNGTSGFVNVDYSGRQQLMRVSPLDYLSDPGLTLIVYRDTNYFRTINMACMLTFGLLVSMFGLPVLAALALYVTRCGAYPLERLWPDRAGRAGYVRIVAAAACLATAFAIRYPAMNTDTAAWSVLALFGAAALAAVVACRRPRHSEAILIAAVTLAIVVIAGLSWALPVAAAHLALSTGGMRQRLSNFAMRRSPTPLYTAAAFSLLAAGVALPCFGLFKVAYHSISRLAIESALQDRYDLLAHRAGAIRSYFDDLRVEAGGDKAECGAQLSRLVEQRIKESLDRYDRPIFAPRYTQMAPRDTQTAPRDTQALMEKVAVTTSPVERRIASVAALFPNDTFGARLRRATLTDVSNEESPWMTGVVNGYEVVALGKTPGGLRETSLRGVYPRWRIGVTDLLITGFLAYVLILWVGYIVRKLFLTELAQAPPLERWATAGVADSCLLIIGHPKSGRSTAASRIPSKDWIDLAQVVTGGNWSVPELKENIVVVDNFEFDADGQASCGAKLKLLEELVFVHKKRVVLLSTIDPVFHAEARAAASEASRQCLDRWAALLSNFQKLEVDDCMANQIDAYVQEQALSGRDLSPELVALVKEECDPSPQLRKVGIGILAQHAPGSPVSRSQVIEELMDRADAFYRVLLSACTNQERLVLFQLARDGWANPKNARAIQQLERRGLVRRSPGLRLLNESFSRFVKETQLPSEIAKWEQEVQNSTWSALKLGFITAALAGGVWLLYTQQEIFQAGLGYVAAMGTASGAVIGLLRNVTQAKGSVVSDKMTNA